MMSIGDIIRTNREQQSLSQEELSFGICSVSNLSRIENGVQMPSRTTYQAFMERMGLNPEVYPSFIDEREVEAYRLKHSIEQKLIAEDNDGVEMLLEKLEAIPKLERTNQQYIMFIKALLSRAKGDCPNDVLQAMKNVAQMTVKDTSPKNILRQALTRDEISILWNLAISHYNASVEQRGIDLLYALKEYIERKIVDDEGISPMYTAILHSLTNWVGLNGKHNEVIRLCDIGLQRCVEYGAYFSFASLLFNKGYALVMLNHKDAARKYLQEAYYVNRARNKLSSCDIVKGFADEHGIEL